LENIEETRAIIADGEIEKVPLLSPFDPCRGARAFGAAALERLDSSLRDDARHRKSPLRFDRLQIPPSFAHSRRGELRTMILIKPVIAAGAAGAAAL